MDELCKIEAHDAEVLCLEYSSPVSMGKVGSPLRQRMYVYYDLETHAKILQKFWLNIFEYSYVIFFVSWVLLLFYIKY